MMEKLKFNRHYLFLFILYCFGAYQMADLSMFIWSKAVIGSQGFFEVTPMNIARTALIGTTAGYMMVQQVFKGIDREVDDAVNYVLDKIVYKLSNRVKGEGENEQSDFQG